MDSKTKTKPKSVEYDAASAMRMLLNTSKYSDLTIKCKEYTFKVHRSVVCPRSKPIAAAIDGEFKESINNEIDLSEDEPIIVDKFVSFLYTGDFKAAGTVVQHASRDCKKTWPEVLDSSRIPLETYGSTTETDVPNPPGAVIATEDTPTGVLVTLAKVYIFADTWDVSALKDLATFKYELMATEKWNDPAFAESIRLLYLNTQEKDRDIKNIAIRLARQHVKILLDRGEFRSLLKDTSEVALDVLHSVINPQEELLESTPRGKNRKRWNRANALRNGVMDVHDDEQNVMVEEPY